MVAIAPLVTSADLHVIRDPRTFSGYRHVYAHHRAKLWRACAFRTSVRLGLYPNPRDGAIAVVRWWKEGFGDAWKDAYASHRRPSWCVTRKAGEGYRLWVWEFGRKRCVPPDDPRADWFWTAEEAIEHFHRWKRRRYGLWSEHSWYFLRRTGGDEFEPFIRKPYFPPRPRKPKFPSPTPVIPKLA